MSLGADVTTHNLSFQSTSSEEDVVSFIGFCHFVMLSVSIHVLRRGRCVAIAAPFVLPQIAFQSTSSEEDVVSIVYWSERISTVSFNPRPPKRTLCRHNLTHGRSISFVSIHVLRRGRCVELSFQIIIQALGSFNPRPPKRTLCRTNASESSHIPGVSIHVLRRGRCVEFDTICIACIKRFNPRPPKRTLCLCSIVSKHGISCVSIHVLRRGRCVYERVKA